MLFPGKLSIMVVATTDAQFLFCKNPHAESHAFIGPNCCYSGVIPDYFELLTISQCNAVLHIGPVVGSTLGFSLVLMPPQSLAMTGML